MRVFAIEQIVFCFLDLPFNSYLGYPTKPYLYIRVQFIYWVFILSMKLFKIFGIESLLMVNIKSLSKIGQPISKLCQFWEIEMDEIAQFLILVKVYLSNYEKWLSYYGNHQFVHLKKNQSSRVTPLKAFSPILIIFKLNQSESLRKHWSTLIFLILTLVQLNWNWLPHILFFFFWFAIHAFYITPNYPVLEQ